MWRALSIENFESPCRRFYGCSLWLATMQNQTAIAFLYTYRDLSTDAIPQYINFAHCDGVSYQAADQGGIQQTLIAGSLKPGAMTAETIQATAQASDIMARPNVISRPWQ